MASGETRNDRYNDSPKGRERNRRYRATGAHGRNQRRYLIAGGRHQESATKTQRRIDAMVAEHPELEALNGRS